ncbi:MAG: T9SS type A sorting domain-containing protein [Candidatus Kapaibacterium sp.]|jgi:hypothetical protein
MLALLMLAPIFGVRVAFASGEIFTVRGPEEVSEGDDVGIVVTASAREKMYDRSVVIEFPETWKIKRMYAVEAGSETMSGLVVTSMITGMFTHEAGRKVVALSDTIPEPNEYAQGIAYFIVFGTSVPALPTTMVRAALVERINPSTPPERDKKTKKLKPWNTNWKMSFPFHDEFSFAGITGKRIVLTIHGIKGWKNARALTLEGSKYADAVLATRKENIVEFFSNAFSIECWFKALGGRQPILSLADGVRTQAELGLNAMGELRFILPNSNEPDKPIFATRAIYDDGAWHHIAISLDSNASFRVFLDGQIFATTECPREPLKAIEHITLGANDRLISLAIDELRFKTIAYKQVSDFSGSIASVERDTAPNLFALFHFNDHAQVAHSSVPAFVASMDKPDTKTTLPILFLLDSNAHIEETSSPVLNDRVILNATLTSPTKVLLSWRTTSELGVKNYVLQRRVGSFGNFENALTAESKHGSKGLKKGQTIVFRNLYLASEDLPQSRGDVELYYRVAVIGYEGLPEYSEPIKLEYGGDRDIFIEQNEPNPFNPTTSISFRNAKAQSVKLAVYDIIGREVLVLVNGNVSAGKHTYMLDATNWPGGIYFYRVKTVNTTVTRKMVLAK